MTISNPKFSVILTTYNNPEYMEDAILSVLNQTYKNYELIIADDNSSKKEVYEIISKYKNLENVIYFNSLIKEEDRLKTARYATQINTAVRNYSTGDYISYLADDDYYYPNMLEKFADTIRDYNYEVLYCCQDIVSFDKNFIGTRYFEKVLKEGFNLLDHNQVITSRKAFDLVGGWEDSPEYWGGADAYFWLRLQNFGYKFYPVEFKESLQAKRYRENSVQWRVANNLSPI